MNIQFAFRTYMQCALLCSFTLAMSSSASGKPSTTNNETLIPTSVAKVDPILGAQWHKSFLVLGPRARDRFRISGVVDTSLDARVFFVEFKIERRAPTELLSEYQCEINILFDNKMQILLPEGEAGSWEGIALVNRLVSGLPGSQPDNSYLAKMMFLYSNTVHLVSEQGTTTGLTIGNYTKNVMPGVAFMRLLDHGCVKLNRGPQTWKLEYKKELDGLPSSLTPFLTLPVKSAPEFFALARRAGSFSGCVSLARMTKREAPKNGIGGAHSGERAIDETPPQCEALRK
jgi:hypothetical protein